GRTHPAAVAAHPLVGAEAQQGHVVGGGIGARAGLPVPGADPLYRLVPAGVLGAVAVVATGPGGAAAGGGRRHRGSSSVRRAGGSAHHGTGGGGMLTAP